MYTNEFTSSKEILRRLIDTIDGKINVLHCDRSIFEDALYNGEEIAPNKIEISKEAWSLGFKYI